MGWGGVFERYPPDASRQQSYTPECSEVSHCRPPLDHPNIALPSQLILTVRYHSRYGMNFLRVPTSMFFGGNCTIKKVESE